MAIKMELSYKDFIIGTLISSLLSIVILIVAFLPQLFSSNLFIFMFFSMIFIVPYIALFNSYFGLILPIIYLFIFFNYIIIWRRHKNVKWTKIVFIISTILIILSYIVGLIISINHP